MNNTKECESTKRERHRAWFWAASAALGISMLLASCPLAHAWATYSGTSVDSTGKVYGWAVTDGTDVMGFMYHVAYVYTTLTSPSGRVASTAPYWYQAMQSIRADVSLPYDSNDVGVYQLVSQHKANCSFMGWFIPIGTQTGSNTTVPNVILTLRTSGYISPGNSGMSGYSFYNGTTSLGVFYFNGGEAGADFAGWRTGVEIDGSVFPSSYTGLIYFSRTYERKVYNGTTQIASDPPGTVDPMDYDPLHPVTDHDPQSGGSPGMVYDLDAPWLGTGNYPPGTVLRKRANFTESAYIYKGFNTIRVSGYLYWFSRLSVYKTGGYYDVLEQTYPPDNMAGLGTTKLSYNLE